MRFLRGLTIQGLEWASTALEKAWVDRKETARKLPEPDRFQIMIHFAPIPFLTFENPGPGL